MIKDLDPKKRVFASPAFVMEVEGGLYGLFRSVEVETGEFRDGKPLREKVRDIGPIALLRPTSRPNEEQVVAQTFDSKTGDVIYLTPINPETGR